jgi:hypothetical protein
MTLFRTVLLIAWLLPATIPYAQSSQQFPEQPVTSLPENYLSIISAKASALEQQGS